MISTVWNQDPTYWYDRTDLPNQDDYDVIAEWQKAMDDWQKLNQGTPMYAGDTSVDYTRDDGSTGQWFTAGMSENNPSFGLSEAVINANELNRKFMDMVQNPNGPGPGLGLALANMIKQRPDMIQSAYQAVDKNGEPVLAPEVVAYLERLGIRPDSSITQPVTPPQANAWSQERLGKWNNQYITEVERALAEDGRVNVYDPELLDNWERIVAGIPTLSENGMSVGGDFWTHITDFLTKNGLQIDEAGFITPAAVKPPLQSSGPQPPMTEAPEKPPLQSSGPQPPMTQEMGAMSTNYSGGPETQIVPGVNNAKQIQELAKTVPNTGTGDYPEWMQLAMANRGGVRRPMNPRGMLGF